MTRECKAVRPLRLRDRRVVGSQDLPWAGEDDEWPMLKRPGWVIIVRDKFLILCEDEGGEMTRRLDYRLYKLENPSVTVIELAGQIDSAEGLESVEEIATQPETKHVAICMENVTYINSKGCGRLIGLHREVKKKGFHLFIIKPVGGVAKVMKQVGCYRILRIVESLEEINGYEMIGEDIPRFLKPEP